jgi:hypothetical protein
MTHKQNLALIGFGAVVLILSAACEIMAQGESASLQQPTELSESRKNTLRRIEADYRDRRGSKKGPGIGVLFENAEPADIATATQMLTKDLGRDLYRVDLSRFVSKYIGETEKNLRRVFAEARTGNAILFFDEADALFGKRGEVKDSHDRYANIEINYLLQQIENYNGVVILSTKRKEAIDPAFLRRLRFIIEFKPPRAKLSTPHTQAGRTDSHYAYELTT